MAKKNVIIVGATGMVGQGVLLECLDHDQIGAVLVIGRTTLGLQHDKLNEIIHDDFTDFILLREQMSGYDACYFCLGVSAAGLNEEQYSRITYDFTMALANVLFQMNANMTFIYVSGEGTDSTEKGRMMWARVKGKVENDLIKMGFKQTFMLRPGGIIPLRGIKSKTKSYQFFNDYFGWMLKGLKTIFPNAICNTTQIGQAMINATLVGYDRTVLKSRDIIELSTHAV